MSFKDRLRDKIPKPCAKWHQHRFLLTRSQSRHVDKIVEENLKLVLHAARSDDTMFVLSTKIRASPNLVILHVVCMSVKHGPSH